MGAAGDGTRRRRRRNQCSCVAALQLATRHPGDAHNDWIEQGRAAHLRRARAQAGPQARPERVCARTLENAAARRRQDVVSRHGRETNGIQRAPAPRARGRWEADQRPRAAIPARSPRVGNRCARRARRSRDPAQDGSATCRADPRREGGLATTTARAAGRAQPEQGLARPGSTGSCLASRGAGADRDCGD